MRYLLFAVIALIGAEATAAETPPVQPAFVEQLIAKMSAAAMTNPPSRILRYTWHGATVYFVPARCCDVPSALYDATGQRVCEPDGGLVGHGDGKCVDFVEQRSNQALVWSDARKPSP